MAKKEDHSFAGHMRVKGTLMVVIGVLTILNAAYYWVSWPVFIGAALVLAGLFKLVMSIRN